VIAALITKRIFSSILPILGSLHHLQILKMQGQIHSIGYHTDLEGVLALHFFFVAWALFLCQRMSFAFLNLQNTSMDEK
jgi:hypothetical protein